jgi:hypothetical protein
MIIVSMAMIVARYIKSIAVASCIWAYPLVALADGPALCPSTLTPLRVVICGIDRCMRGDLVHLTAPPDTSNGTVVLHKTSLHIRRFHNKRISAGFVLSDLGTIADRGYFRIRLGFPATKGLLEIESEALSRKQAPTNLLLCIFASD